MTFTIANNGDATLNLTGTPKISIGGEAAGDFAVAAQPIASVSIGANTTFVVRFSPSAVGARTATVTIVNDDDQHNPYTFTIRGTGVQAPAFISAAPAAGTYAAEYRHSFTAAGSPAPTFSVAGGSLPNGLTLDGTSGVLSGKPMAAGSFSFLVTAGNGAGTDTQNVMLVIDKATQTIDFAALSDTAYGEPPFAVTATASSGLAVSLGSNTPGVCTVDNMSITIVGTGTCTITANQAGNEQYLAAPQEVQSFVVMRSPINAIAWLPVVSR